MSELRRGFTLIEMLISIAVLMIVAGFFVFFIADTKTKIGIQTNIKERLCESAAAKNILYDDLALAKDKIQITGGNTYKILYIQTDNSIYGTQRPFVAWAVLSDKRLIRYESAYKFTLPITSENQNTIFAHTVIKICDKFVVFQSKDNKNFGAFIEANGDKRAILMTAPSVKLQ